LNQLRQYVEAKQGICLKPVKETRGTVSVQMSEGMYYLSIECLVPEEYPAKPAVVSKTDSNLPSELLSLFLMTAREKAKRLAELSEFIEDAGKANAREGAGSGIQSKSEKLSQSQTLSTRNKVSSLAVDAEDLHRATVERRRQLEASFASKSSLFPTIVFLYEDCLCALAGGKCLVCSKQILPSNHDCRGMRLGLGLRQVIHLW